MVNRIWPTAVVGEGDSVISVSASACHIGGPNSVNPGQILLVYGIQKNESVAPFARSTLTDYCSLKSYYQMT